MPAIHAHKIILLGNLSLGGRDVRRSRKLAVTLVRLLNAFIAKAIWPARLLVLIQIANQMSRGTGVEAWNLIVGPAFVTLSVVVRDLCTGPSIHHPFYS